MPQLIGIILVVGLVLYALSVIIPIAIYSAIYWIPAFGVCGIVGIVSAYLIDSIKKEDSFVIADLSQNPPLVFRRTQSVIAEPIAMFSGMLGLAGGCWTLKALYDGIPSASSGDPIWMRQTAIWIAGIFLLITGIWYQDWLKKKIGEASDSPIEHVNTLLAEYCGQHSAATSSAARLSFKLPELDFEFLKTAQNSGDVASMETVLGQNLEERCRELRQTEIDFEFFSNALDESRTLLSAASLHAARSGRKTLLSMTDQAHEVLNSSALTNLISARNVSEFKRILLDTNDSLRVVLNSPLDGREKFDEGHSSEKTTPQDDSNLINIKTESDALKFLGLPPDAPQAVIKRRIDRLTAHFHPDKAVDLTSTERDKNESKMKLVNRARDVLVKSSRL